MNYSRQEIEQFRRIYKSRRTVRIAIFVTILCLLIAVTVAAFPSWRLFGLPKLAWAPYFYLILFGLLAAIVFVWRCPVCNGLLDDVFSGRYCPKCGFKLNEDDTH